MKNKFLIFALLISIQSFGQNISEVKSFRAERFWADYNNYPKALYDNENRCPDFALNKAFMIEMDLQGETMKRKGQNVFNRNPYLFSTTVPYTQRHITVGNNAIDPKHWEDFTQPEIDNLVSGGNAFGTNYAKYIEIDFEYNVNWDDPRTYHNFAYLIYKGKQNNPNSYIYFHYIDIGHPMYFGTSYTANNAVIWSYFKALTNPSINYPWENGHPEIHKAMFNNATISQLNPAYNVRYADCGNKTLWELIEIIDSGYGGYDIFWANNTSGDGVTQNQAQANQFLSQLSGQELIKKADPTKKIESFNFEKNEGGGRFATNFHIKTTEGNIYAQDKIPVNPSMMQNHTIWGFWKCTKVHWWEAYVKIEKNNDANLTSNYFPTGPGQGLNFTQTRYNSNLTPNYNQGCYNGLYPGTGTLAYSGHSYDNVLIAAHKYSQIEPTFGTTQNSIPVSFEYARGVIDASGSITYPAYTSYTPPQNGAVYAEAAITKRPLVEYRQVGNKFAVLASDLFPNNATNPTKYRVVLGGVVSEFVTWGSFPSLFTIN